MSKELQERFSHLQHACIDTPYPLFVQRCYNLKKLQYIIMRYKDTLIQAVHDDFGCRSHHETMVTEIFPALEAIQYNIKNLRRWMRPSRRRTPLVLLGVKAVVHYQPLGVVGIVVPWNFPIFLSLLPLIGALAAGNRVFIKTSEYAPKTGKVLADMIAEEFRSDEISVMGGDAMLAEQFTQLPFDHLLFTGSTSVGKKVMQSAANNLTPVTLELGGKSPAIIHDSFPMTEAAKRIIFGKALNAGQTCVAPDYILVLKGEIDTCVKALTDAFHNAYPTALHNADYTAIITDNQKSRLQHMIKDAEAKGASITVVNPASEDFLKSKKMPLHIVTNVTNDMMVMQDEIFGPVLPILEYDDLDDAITYVNNRPRPLALYYFDWHKGRSNTIIHQTCSGGVCINDILTHTIVDDMPFGGVGASGMGHYHGHEGFLTFSKAKSTVTKRQFDVSAMIGPPWGNTFYNLYERFNLWRYKTGNNPKE